MALQKTEKESNKLLDKHAKKANKKITKKPEKKTENKTEKKNTKKAIITKPSKKEELSKAFGLLGQTLTDFEVELYSNNKASPNLVRLSSLVGKKGMVLYFYPKDSTPGCTTEACNFRDSKKLISLLGYSVVGVSPDSITSHQRFSQKHDLNFDLISDTNKTLCQEFKVWQQKQLYGRQFMGVVRSTFLIDNKLKVWHVISPVRVKDHNDEILDLIKK